MVSPFEKYDTKQEPPFDDWVHSPSNVLKEEHILDAIGLDGVHIPRKRAVVLHQNQRDYNKPLIRVEARIGQSGSIGNTYIDQAEKIMNSPFFFDKRHGEDTTYVNFYFNVPEIFIPILEEL